MMRGVFGFCVEVCVSQLEGGGRGVVVREGPVPAGHLVGLYPGMHCVVLCINNSLGLCVDLLTLF